MAPVSIPPDEVDGPDASPAADAMPVRAARAQMLQHLSWSVFGGLLAAALLYGCIVLAGRLLGPAEFGRFAFATAAAQAMMVVVAGGMDLASSRSIARAKTRERLASVVASSLLVVSSTGSAIAVLVAITASSLAEVVGVPAAVLRLAAVLAALYAVKAVVDRQLAALGLLRFQATVKPIEAIIAASLILIVLLWWNERSAVAALACFVAASATLVSAYVLRLRSVMRLGRVDRSVLRELGSYARVALAAAIVPVPLLYGDRFVVQRALSDAEAGIYLAYATSSFLVVAQVLMLVNNVLFPAISRIEDKAMLVRRLRRTSIASVLPLAMAVAGFLTGMLVIFGDEYPRVPLLLALFGAWSALHFLNGLAVTVVMAHSVAAYRRYVTFTAARSIAFVAWLLVVVTQLDAQPALLVGGLVAAELLDVLVLQWLFSRMVVGVPSDRPSDPVDTPNVASPPVLGAST